MARGEWSFSIELVGIFGFHCIFYDHTQRGGLLYHTYCSVLIRRQSIILIMWFSMDNHSRTIWPCRFTPSEVAWLVSAVGILECVCVVLPGRDPVERIVHGKGEMKSYRRANSARKSPHTIYNIVCSLSSAGGCATLQSARFVDTPGSGLVIDFGWDFGKGNMFHL